MLLEELEQLKNQIVTADQAAKILGVKVGTLEKWRRSKRHNLPYSKVGHTIRYSGKNLAALLEPKAAADPDVQPGGRRRRRKAA